MTTTQHPLTETAAAEMWDAAHPKRAWAGPLPRGFLALLRAAFDAGREHKAREILAGVHAVSEAAGESPNGYVLRPLADRLPDATPADPHHDPRPWQDCTLQDIREGDLVETQDGDLTVVGVAHSQDEGGYWWTEGSYPLACTRLRTYRRIPTPPAEEVELPTVFGAVILDPRWGTRRHTRAVHLGEGVWAAEVTPGADVYTHLARDLHGATLPDGTRARRDGERADGTPRFVKVQEGEK